MKVAGLFQSNWGIDTVGATDTPMIWCTACGRKFSAAYRPGEIDPADKDPKRILFENQNGHR